MKISWKGTFWVWKALKEDYVGGRNPFIKLTINLFASCLVQESKIFRKIIMEMNTMENKENVITRKHLTSSRVCEAICRRFYVINLAIF